MTRGPATGDRRRAARRGAAALALSLAVIAAAGPGCGNGSAGGLSGAVRVDGGATVGPYGQVAGELFRSQHPDVTVTVGLSGTPQGLQRLCAGEIDIAGAARPIREAELRACRAEGVTVVGVPVAHDGVAVVRHRRLGTACLTIDQVRGLWAGGPGARGIGSSPVRLYGAGPNAAAFTYMREILRTAGPGLRAPTRLVDDERVLVKRVARDPLAVGYVGFGVLDGDGQGVAVVAVDGGAGCVRPSRRAIQDGRYRPLSRTLFMYVSADALAREEVGAFLAFANANQEEIATTAGMIPLTARQAAAGEAEIRSRRGAGGEPPVAGG